MSWHQVPHYRTSKKGKRFIAGLGKKKTARQLAHKTIKSMAKKYRGDLGFIQHNSQLGGAKVGNVNQKLVSMLKENTGIAMMDSGGESGRAWQQNQGKNFEGERSFKIELNSRNDFIVTLSTYHFLKEKLQMTPSSEALQRKFKAFAKKHEDAYDLSNMEEFAEQLEIATGLYGEGKPFTVNTYNYESMLDQVLQYEYFELNGKAYVILQIHGGADVRGGYTDPYVFEVDSDNWVSNDTNAYIYFTDDTSIYTDDSNHWYDNDSNEVKIEYVEGQPETNPSIIKVNGEPKNISYR